MSNFRMYPLKLSNVLRLFKQREYVNLEPPYQRLSVWDKEKQQSLIDSIINGFDIPKLYFHEISPNSSQSRQFKYAVIDGKQRMMAIWAFMLGDLRLSSDFVFFDADDIKAGGSSYGDLMINFPRLRARFDSFDIPITLVQTDDEDFIEDLFARLNIQVPLSAAERRNALGGPLPYIIRKIGVSPFFSKSVRIRNNRLQHFDMAAKFLYLMRADDFASTKKDQLDDFVLFFRTSRRQNSPETSDSNLKLLENRTLKILDTMHRFFKNKDYLLVSQGRATLYFHIFRLYDKLGEKVKVPFNAHLLEEFNEAVTSARHKSQRMATGSSETLSDQEYRLLDFDREKQSPNDGGALIRQYSLMQTYFKTVYTVELTELTK